MVRQKRCHRWVNYEDNIAAIAAITAIGAAQGFELFAQHRNTAVPAVSRGDCQRDTINKVRHAPYPSIQAQRAARNRTALCMKIWFLKFGLSLDNVHNLAAAA